MRIVRLAVLTALTLSLFAVPNGSAKNVNVLRPGMTDAEYDIDCQFDGTSEGHCSGSLEYCLGYCHAICGSRCVQG